MAEHYDLFLSYARADDDPAYTDPNKSFLRRLYNDLTAAEYKVWWDRESMPSRALTFLQEIRDAITACDKLILVVGPGALESDYVKAEWEYALSICLPVIPILRAGDYALIPPALKKWHAPDFRDSRPYADALAELKRILAEPTAPLGRLHAVPPLPPWYIRRGDSLDALVRTVCADSHKPVVITSKKQIVALQGMGGIGKTVLAAALCRECDVRYSFPDGVFWVEVGQTPQIATRLGDIGHAFGDDRGEYPDEQRGRSRLTALLEDKSVLLVLDDVWDHRHVEAFRVVGPRGRLVITTRSGRLVTQVGALNQAIDTLTDEEGRALIAERLGIDPADLPAECTDIIRLLEGHTLAITIAAAQLSERGLDFAPRLLDRLRRRRDGDNPFKDLIISDDDKNQNLELSLSLSYDDLAPDLQRRFRLTGVFAPGGTFDRAAAMAVWGDADEDDADDALNDLIQAGLLEAFTPEPSPSGRGETRYSQHGLLRAYARALLQREGELDDAQRRHFGFYITAHTLELTPREMKLDFENIQLALSWGNVHEPKTTCDYLLAVGDFLHTTIAISSQRLLYTEAVQTARYISYAQAEANFSQILGYLNMRLGEFDGASKYYRDAIELYGTASDRAGLAHCLKAFGDLKFRSSELGAAQKLYSDAIEIYEESLDRHGAALTHKALGDLYRSQDDYSNATIHFQQACEIFEMLGDQLNLASAFFSLGEIKRCQDEYSDARVYYERAKVLYEQSHGKAGLANTLQALGDLSMRLGNLVDAQSFYSEAIDLYRHLGDQLGLANTLKALGDLSLRMGNLNSAYEAYSQVLTFYEHIGDKLGLANTLRNLAEVCVQRGGIAESKAYYTRAVDLYVSIDNKLGLANTLLGLGEVARMEDEYGAARGYYERALPLYEQTGARLGQAYALKELGEVARMEDEYGAARGYYERALSLYEQTGDRLGQADTLLGLGDVALHGNEYGAARGYCGRALSLYEQIGDLRGQADALKALGDVALHENEYGAARGYYERALPIYEQIGDLTGRLNVRHSLARLETALNNIPAACQYYRQLFEIADAHPFFREHPVVKNWRAEYAQLGCEG